MTRVSLSRLPGDRVLVVDGDVERAVAVADLPAYVEAREAAGAPRWVWDDTARWYPPLLAAGVRVERCHDLRLCHHLLRRAPAVDGQLLAGEQSEHWDRLGPSTPSDPALFSVDDTTEHLRADLEDARQSAAVAASAEAARLRLLLAAESVGGPGRGRDDVRRGAVAGRRPRAPAHRPAGAAAAARRPAAGLRGAGGRGARRVRCARASTPTRATRAAGRAAPGRAGRHGHPGVLPASARAPGHRPAAALQAARAPVPDQRLGLDRPVGERRPVPAVVPAGRLHHRPVVVQRRRRAVVPGADPARGRGRRRLDVRGRRRRPARAAGARRHERRPRAGQVGARRRPLPGDGRGRRGGQPQRRQARPARGDVRRHQRRERPDGRRAHPALPRMPSASSRRRPGPASGARWCARCSGAGHRPWATPGTGTRTARPPTPTAGPATGARTAASPATSSCRAPAPSGRCAGSPTCATGSGGWARPARSTRARTWSSSSTTRSSCTPRPRWPTRSSPRPPRWPRPPPGLLFRDLAVDFPLTTSVVRSYADAGKPGPGRAGLAGTGRSEGAGRAGGPAGPRHRRWDDAGVSDFLGEWQAWRDVREKRLRDPRGWLAITAVHWLTAAPQRFDDIPGEWYGDARGATVNLAREEALTAGDAVLTEGEHLLGPLDEMGVTVTFGDAVAQVADRDGQPVVRPRHPDSRTCAPTGAPPATRPTPTGCWRVASSPTPLPTARPSARSSSSTTAPSTGWSRGARTTTACDPVPRRHVGRHDVPGQPADAGRATLARRHRRASTSTGRSTCPAPTPTSPPARCPRPRTRCRSRSRRASRRRP